jgi:hypothetical protein
MVLMCLRIWNVPFKELEEGNNDFLDMVKHKLKITLMLKVG